VPPVAEALFYILGGAFIVLAVVVALGAAGGKIPEKAIPGVVGLMAAVAIAAVVFAVIWGNENSPTPEKVAGATESEAETGEEVPGEEEPSTSTMEEESAGMEEETTPEEESEEGGVMEEESGAAEEGEAEGGATADAAAGEEVFAENCSTCHGATGHGGNGGPDLRTMPKAKEQAGAEEQVTNGGGGMPAFSGTLSEEEISNVAAYVVEDIVGGK
jgi:cytochrome c551